MSGAGFRRVRRDRARPPARGEAPGGRTALPVRLEALRILDQVLQANGNSSLLLEHAWFASGADRGLATELVLGVLRRCRALDHALAACSARPLASLDPRLLVALRLGAYQILHLDRVPDYAAVDATVEAAKRHAGIGAASYVNGVLRALLRQRAKLQLPASDDPGACLRTTWSLPDPLARRWEERYGSAASLALAEAASRPAPLTLRVIGSRGTVAEAREALAEAGIETRPGRYLEEALVVTAGAVIPSRPFRIGLVTVQDEAAQLVARLLAARPGERLLDACAAPGGKSLALADLTRNQSLVVALDNRAGRLRLLRESLRRTHLGGVRLVGGDAASPPFTRPFDRVLVDAPCTGTGTLRRNPEIRYRVNDEAIARSGERARRIVAGAAPLVAAGGRLVYATCSLEPEENEAVIAWLLERDPALVPVDPRPDLPEAARHLVGDDLWLRTHPGDPELDGFTACVLERRS